VVDQIQTCYKHPDRRAGVVCQRCDRRICPDCMRQASVGFHCPECTKSGAQKIIRGPAALVTRPIACQSLIAMNAVVYFAGLGSSTGRTSFEARGGLNGPAVAAGEWYRLITSGFLHSNLIHLGLNMYLLYVLGTMLEPILGAVRFVALYFLALVAGSLGVLLLDPNHLTVGASGAVFGLMGAAFLAQRMRGIDPFASGLGGLLVINLAFTFLIPGISIGGHLGGLVGGFLGGWILLDAAPKMTRSTVLPALVCLALAGGLFGAGLVVAGA
jgi:membrane associated rhomboid family serine protease